MINREYKVKKLLNNRNVEDLSLAPLLRGGCFKRSSQGHFERIRELSEVLS